MPPSVGSVMTTNSGVIPRSWWRYCQHRPSQSSSCTVPVTRMVTSGGIRPSSFMILAPYTADTTPPRWSEAPRPPISVSVS